jgi:RNA polymerase sigma factor (sigma-70 family)
MSNPKPSGRLRKPYVMAVVLGTALAALGSSEPLMATAVSDQDISNISRYCTACWRNARLPADRWGDCTQEVFERLLERVPMTEWDRLLATDTEERREFMRAIDTVKKRHQRDRARSGSLAEVVPDTADPRLRQDREDREAVRQASSAVLSDRQQRILELICEGHGVTDIAGELNMTPERVSDEKYKAIRKLRSYFSSDPETAA